MELIFLDLLKNLKKYHQAIALLLLKRNLVKQMVLKLEVNLQY